MEWIQVIFMSLANLGIIIPLILWMRTESRSDTRLMLTMIDNMKAETANNMLAIREEMKDFHGRLCAIEERGRK